MLNFLEIICFEMSKFKKIAMKGKTTKKNLVETRRLLLQANSLVKKDVLKLAPLYYGN
jgi:hypothetical protein